MAASDKDRSQSVGEPSSPVPPSPSTGRSRAGTLLSKAQEAFAESSIPTGMHAAWGQMGTNIPTVTDVEKGNFGTEGWSGVGQRRNSSARRDSDISVLHAHLERKKSLAADIKNNPLIESEVERVDSEKISQEPTAATEAAPVSSKLPYVPHDPSVPYANGYQFPPKHTKWYATKVLLLAFWRFVTTPTGFIITIYAANVVAWGGMLFLILIHATPALGKPSYNADYSKAKIWLEIDSQVLTALFCVTAFGLIPWRFRDLYFLLKWRWGKDPVGLRRLAGIHRGWFRLEGSEDLDVLYHPAVDAVPAGVDEAVLAFPIEKSPDAPLTGERAPPSKYWKLDLVIWMFVANTLLQAILCGFMWGENRFHRPSWVTGLLISTGCIVAMVGGWIMFAEGKRVKKIEGVPVSAEDQEILRQMREKSLTEIVTETV